MKQAKLKCVNSGKYLSYIFRLTLGSGKSIHFESFSDGSVFKPIDNKFFTIEEAEQIITALKEKPNLPLLIKRHKREMKEWELLHTFFIEKDKAE